MGSFFCFFLNISANVFFFSGIILIFVFGFTKEE